MLEKSDDKSKKVKAKIMREVAASNAEYFAHNIIAMEAIHKKYVNIILFLRFISMIFSGMFLQSLKVETFKP